MKLETCLLTASVKLPPEKFASSSKDGAGQEIPTEPKKFILNSGEELYAELRDKNFNAVGSTLSKKAKLITAQFDVSSIIVVPCGITWQMPSASTWLTLMLCPKMPCVIERQIYGP